MRFVKRNKAIMETLPHPLAARPKNTFLMQNRQTPEAAGSGNVCLPHLHRVFPRKRLLNIFMPQLQGDRKATKMMSL